MNIPFLIFLSFLALLLTIFSIRFYFSSRYRFGQEFSSKLLSNIFPVLGAGLLFLLLSASIPVEWGWPFILSLALISSVGIWYRIIYLNWFAQATGIRLVDLGPQKIIPDRGAVIATLSGIFTMLWFITEPGLRALGLLFGFLLFSAGIFLLISGQHPRAVTDHGFYLHGRRINWENIESYSWFRQHEKEAYISLTLLRKDPFFRTLLVPIPNQVTDQLGELLALHLDQIPSSITNEP